jgi:hypothetical protein
MERKSLGSAKAFAVEHVGDSGLIVLRQKFRNALLDLRWRFRRPHADRGSVNAQ